MAEKCIACGMPMEALEDRAGSDPKKPYCQHCARPDGRMQSYEEKLDSMTRFIVRTEGRSESSAREKASKWLARQPAWQNRDL